MKIDIKHLGKLARLRIDEEQEKRYASQMQEIVAMVEKLPELKSKDSLVDPKHPIVFRKDEADDSFRREEILKNAPQVQAGCVVVPKIID